MKKKKGFTLVELIVVIAILAVILLLVVPNIVDMFNNGKKDSFIRQVQAVWREAEKEYTVNLANEKKSYVYSDKKTAVGKELSLNKSKVSYVAGFDVHGDISFIAVGNNDFCYVTNNPSSIDIKREDIVEEELICTSGECRCGNVTASVPENNVPIDNGGSSSGGSSSGGSSSGGTSSGGSSSGGSSSGSNKITVKVVCNNCTSSPGNSKIANKGETVTFQITPSQGYTLENATVTGSCVLVNGVLKTGNVQTNTTCTVNVTERIFTVSFDANGGENAPESQTIKFSESPYQIPDSKPDKFGYIFNGWSTSRTGGVEYNPNDYYNDLNDVTLYAVWYQVSRVSLGYNVYHIESGMQRLHSFVPEESGSYTIYTEDGEGNVKVWGCLYDEYGNRIQFSDINWDLGGNRYENFSITQNLTAGTTYYIGVGNNRWTGAFAVMIVCNNCSH